MKGRSTAVNPPNRFETKSFEPIEIDLPEDEERPPVPTRFYRDTSRTILARNDSPDVPFTFSVNPYRGCEHGCIYCYARPSHEYLGFSAGLDFESRIMVKTDAPALLRKEFMRKGWIAQTIAFSGNTDCYQPVERKLELTRQCLEVCLEFGNPVGIITKNTLLLRDLEILRKLAASNLVHVLLSITTLDTQLARTMEPRTASPDMKLGAIESLAGAGIPAGVMIAPVVPGLTDREIPEILKQSARHGATSAGYILLRLPGAVEPLFLEWLEREFPERRKKVIGAIRNARGGGLSDTKFGRRMKGEGPAAEVISDLFALHARKYQLGGRWKPLSTEKFRRSSNSQLALGL
ncbi:MAG: PA0069 family radical SAM protein [Ignavibacteria bacterium]|nr:PA0069 family radical SAM protein [Ignavibacteria bacterium]